MKNVCSSVRSLFGAVYRTLKLYANNKYILFARKHKLGKRGVINTRDLLYFQTDNNELMRMDIIVRYLVVESYKYGVFSRGSIDALGLYKKMQETRITNKTNYGSTAVNQYMELIESFEKKGYDSNSYITVDKNLTIIDGSHRLALSLYFDIPLLSILIINTEFNGKDYSIDWFFKNGFSTDEIKLIQNKAHSIISNTPHKNRQAHQGNDLGRNTDYLFTGMVWSPADSISGDIIADLRVMGSVTNVQRREYSEGAYENIVRSIYKIDDISDEKINTKINAMKGEKYFLTSFDIVFPSPLYRLKKKTNLPLSMKVERVKRNIRNRYKNSISNYVYDNIIHICDNNYQSEYVRKILDPIVTLKEDLNQLEDYTYILLNSDTPYMPHDFPETIPVGKDLDILCSMQDYENIKNYVVEKYKSLISCDYDLNIIEGDQGTQIRIEYSGLLIFQFDISVCVVNNQHFSEDMLVNRVKKTPQNYYVSTMEYELVYRLYKYSRNNKKKYHLEFVLNHWQQFNIELLEKYDMQYLRCLLDGVDWDG